MSEQIRYEDVKNETAEEYFAGNHVSIHTFKNKYLNKNNPDEKTPADVFHRVAKAVASMESTDEARERWYRQWFHEMYTSQWLPGGSVLEGAGNPAKISLNNCTHLGFTGDSLEAIYETEYAMAKCAAHRQGLGIHFNLRPDGMKINNSARISSGNGHWINKFNTVGKFVGQKGRIPAFLCSIADTNPDLVQFITLKSNQTEIDNANISVHFSDAFMKAVEKGAEWELSFTAETGEKMTKTLPANEIFDLFVMNNRAFAEPGAQFIDTMKRMSNSDYLDDSRWKVRGTNAPVPGDSFVTTENGLARIEDLYNLQQEVNFLCHSATEKNEALLSIWRFEDHDGAKLTLHSGKVKKFKDQTVCKIFLKSGKILRSNIEHSWFTNKGMVETGELTTGDVLMYNDLPHPMSLTAFEELPIARFLGWFVGDGFYVKESRHHPNGFIGMMWQSHETEIQELFQTIYKETSQSEKNLYVKQRCNNSLEEVRTSNSKVYKLFEDYGFTFGEKHHVPKECYTNPIFARNFISGLFESDGCFGDDRIVFTTVSEKLVTEVQDVIHLWTGIRGKIKSSQPKGVPYTLKNGEEKVSNAKRRYDLRIKRHRDQLLFLQWIRCVTQARQKAILSIKAKLTANKPSRFLSNYNKDVVNRVEITSERIDMYCGVVPETSSLIIDGYLSSNCSEKVLEFVDNKTAVGVCALASWNAIALPKNLTEATDYLSGITGDLAYSMCRFMDNILLLEVADKRYPLEGQKESIEHLRRLGLGFTNMDGYLITNGIGYDTDAGIDTMVALAEAFNLGCYRANIELGKERGNFKAFVREQWERAPFVANMIKNFHLDFTHARFVECTTIAPTGTLSLMLNTRFHPLISTGVEPVTGFYWWKKERTSGKYNWSFNVPDFVRVGMKTRGVDLADHGMPSSSVEDNNGKIGLKIIQLIEQHFPESIFKPAHKVDPYKKIDLLAKLYRSAVDAAISVTFNLPEDVTVEEIKKIYMTAWKKGVKAVSIYRDRSREGVLEFDPPPVVEKRFQQDHQALANVAKQQPLVMKRPACLPADVYHSKINGEAWVTFVGLMDGKPYEVFSGKEKDLLLPRKYVRGQLEKQKRKYFFTSGEGEEEIRVSVQDHFMNDEQAAMTRLLSLNLRHGTPLIYIIDQLDKSHGTIVDFSKNMMRVLKNYLDAETIKGTIKCSHCGSRNLIYQEKCFTCVDCGMSKCG